MKNIQINGSNWRQDNNNNNNDNNSVINASTNLPNCNNNDNNNQSNGSSTRSYCSSLTNNSSSGSSINTNNSGYVHHNGSLNAHHDFTYLINGNICNTNNISKHIIHHNYQNQQANQPQQQQLKNSNVKHSATLLRNDAARIRHNSISKSIQNIMHNPCSTKAVAAAIYI